MTWCRYADLAGVPGEGIHCWRIPGTPTPAADYILTLLLAWFISWTCSVSLALTTAFLIMLGMFLHAVFCVQIGVEA